MISGTATVGVAQAHGRWQPDQRARIQALAAFNFFVAAIQTGFGPFIGLALVGEGWDQTQIGIALSAGTIAALALQLPGGALVDAVHSKRLILAGAVLMTGGTALIMGAVSGVIPVFTAQVLHAAAATVIMPAIAATTLTLCGHAGLGIYLGTNTRWASLGSAVAAVLFGFVASRFSPMAVFLAAGALCIPAVAALKPLRPVVEAHKDHPALLHPAQRRRHGHRFWRIFLRLHLHTFAICVLLFQLADAAMLPIAVNALAKQPGSHGFVVSGAILTSQLMVAAISPSLGRAAERRGRRPILLLGFAMLPIRGVLLALLSGSVPLVMVQALDGVSGAVMGIMVPLIAADLTRRTAFLNLAINSINLAGGLGATVSTSAAGWIADQAGTSTALLCLAVVGLGAVVLLALMMPETRPADLDQGAPAGTRS